MVRESISTCTYHMEANTHCIQVQRYFSHLLKLSPTNITKDVLFHVKVFSEKQRNCCIILKNMINFYHKYNSILLQKARISIYEPPCTDAGTGKCHQKLATSWKLFTILKLFSIKLYLPIRSHYQYDRISQNSANALIV